MPPAQDDNLGTEMIVGADLRRQLTCAMGPIRKTIAAAPIKATAATIRNAQKNRPVSWST